MDIPSDLERVIIPSDFSFLTIRESVSGVTPIRRAISIPFRRKKVSLSSRIKRETLDIALGALCRCSESSKAEIFCVSDAIRAILSDGSFFKSSKNGSREILRIIESWRDSQDAG